LQKARRAERVGVTFIGKFINNTKVEDIKMKLTREEAVRRWNAAIATKRAAVEKMQKMLSEDYKLRTGKEPVGFNVL